MSSNFESFHVVLVEPGESLNVGSVARAMRNLGFRHLHLVAPRNYDRSRANVTACWSEPILDDLILHETFAEALIGMEDVVGLSGRPTKAISASHFVTLPEWSGGLPSRPPRKTALVFGPEDNGLRQEYLEQCRWIVRIPSTEECSSFNLAQATLLVLYEITKTLPGSSMPAASQPQGPQVTWNDYFQLDRLLDSVMQESGFVRTGTPAHVPGTVKNLFRRLPINPQEMGIILGLFGRIQTALRRRE